MSAYAAAAAIQLAGGSLRPGIFFRLATDPLVRLWGGVGNFELPADNIEIETATYKGAGQLHDLPSLQQLLNGVAERAVFTLSGVDERIAQLADSEAEAVRGAAVNIGFAALDADWQRTTPAVWLWEGEADTLTMDSKLDGDQRVYLVNLSVGSAFTGRRRPGLRLFTDAFQRRRSPDDRFCERVASTGQYSKTWPRFS